MPLFRRLKLGAVLGYLAAGMIIGPWGLGVIPHAEATLDFAELGVVLLLFLVGLELEPSRLWALRQPVFGLGGAQVFVTGAVLTGLAQWWGLGWQAATVVGFGLAMSSTAIVLAWLGERNELSSPSGRRAFAILALPGPGRDSAHCAPPIAGAGKDRCGERLGARGQRCCCHRARRHRQSLAGAPVVKGRRAFRRAGDLHRGGIAGGDRRGAFDGRDGVVDVARRLSRRRAAGRFGVPARLEANVEPFKGLLLGLFFMAVGMSANLAYFVAHPFWVLGVAIALMLLKALLLWAISGATHAAGNEDAQRIAVLLAQGGEFSFVLFTAAQATGILTGETAEFLVLTVTISMLLAPLSFVVHERLLARWLERSKPPEFDLIDGPGNPVIIAGYGRYGQIVSRVLRMAGIPFTALEISYQQVDFVRKFGNKVYYGDASRLELLESAKAHDAKLFILAIDDVEASVKTATIVRKHFPDLPILARARNRVHHYRLRDLGIEAIERETLLSSLETARHAFGTNGPRSGSGIARRGTFSPTRRAPTGGAIRRAAGRGATDPDHCTGSRPVTGIVRVGREGKFGQVGLRRRLDQRAAAALARPRRAGTVPAVCRPPSGDSVHRRSPATARPVAAALSSR